MRIRHTNVTVMKTFVRPIARITGPAFDESRDCFALAPAGTATRIRSHDRPTHFNDRTAMPARLDRR